MFGGGGYVFGAMFVGRWISGGVCGWVGERGVEGLGVFVCVCGGVVVSGWVRWGWMGERGGG